MKNDILNTMHQLKKKQNESVSLDASLRECCRVRVGLAHCEVSLWRFVGPQGEKLPERRPRFAPKTRRRESIPRRGQRLRKRFGSLLKNSISELLRLPCCHDDPDLHMQAHN